MSWIEFKTELVKKGLLPVIFLQSADSALAVSLAIKASTEANANEPLLYEKYVADVGAILDRALAFRREWRELEILAVKAAADYALFVAQSDIELAINETRLAIESKRLALTTQQNAAQAFQSGTGSLEHGFHELARGSVDQLSQDIKDAEQLQRLIIERKNVQRSYQDAYWTRYTESGNAHNYQQRADRVANLLVDDLVDCFLKLNAAAAGYEMIYGEAFSPLPPIESESFVDDLVMWFRAFSRHLELKSEKETEYDLTLSLVQPTSPVVAVSLIDESHFVSARNVASSGKPDIGVQDNRHVYIQR